MARNMCLALVAVMFMLQFIYFFLITYDVIIIPSTLKVNPVNWSNSNRSFHNRTPIGNENSEQVTGNLSGQRNLTNTMQLGGHYIPQCCPARSKVAIIVPFRNRDAHLRILLHNLIPMLVKQQLEFRIFVVEQAGSDLWNKGVLLNAGFVEANKQYPYWQCFIFHDVDLIPERNDLPYDCPLQPRHMYVAADRWNYTLPYADFAGGVLALTKEHFKKVNGFSNMFWRWGGEDDDMAMRIKFQGLNISRPSAMVARYTALGHTPQEENPDRWNILRRGNKQMYSDGLTNLNYTIKEICFKNTYTLIKVQMTTKYVKY